jgi:hypothetical protein
MASAVLGTKPRLVNGARSTCRPNPCSIARPLPLRLRRPGRRSTPLTEECRQREAKLICSPGEVARLEPTHAVRGLCHAAARPTDRPAGTRQAMSPAPVRGLARVRERTWIGYPTARGASALRYARVRLKDQSAGREPRVASPIALPADSFSLTFAAVPAPSRRVAHARFKAR